MAVVQILRGGFGTPDFRSCFTFCCFVELCPTQEHLHFIRWSLSHSCAWTTNAFLSSPLLFVHPLVFSSFVLVNSVAMEGDGCAVCSTSEAKLVALSHKLNCSQQVRDYWRSDYSQRLLCHNVNADTVAQPGYNQTVPKKSASNSQYNLLASLSPPHIPLNHVYLTINSVA